MAPTLSSSYVAYRGGTCTAGHIRSPSTDFPEGKTSPAQEGRVEGHPVGSMSLTLLYAPSLERLQRLCEHLALQSCQSGALVLPASLFFILNSFRTATTQNNNRWTAG